MDTRKYPLIFQDVRTAIEPYTHRKYAFPRMNQPCGSLRLTELRPFAVRCRRYGTRLEAERSGREGLNSTGNPDPNNEAFLNLGSGQEAIHLAEGSTPQVGGVTIHLSLNHEGGVLI